MVDWPRVRAALLAIRASHRPKFARSRIAAQTLKDLENPQRDFRPTVDKIDEFLEIAGTTLGEFFAQFDEKRSVRQIPGHDDIYESVAAVLSGADIGRIEALRAALKYFAPEVKKLGRKTGESEKGRAG